MRWMRMIRDKNFYKLQVIVNDLNIMKVIRKIEFEQNITTPFPDLIPDPNEKSSKLFIGPTSGFNHESYYGWTVELRKVNLTPVQFLEKIVEFYGLKPKEERKLLRGLELRLFFGKKYTAMTTPISIATKLADTKDYIDLKVRIYRWTTQEDLFSDDIWNEIKRLKLSAWKTEAKNKDWDRFFDDIRVYKLFQKVENDLKNGVIMDQSEPKDPYYQMKEYPEYKELDELYNFNLKALQRRIIKKCKELLDGLNLLNF